MSLENGNTTGDSEKACPECSSGELDGSGKCLVCGYRTTDKAAAEPSPPPKVAAFPGAIPVTYSARSEGEPVPAWREELSKRLQEIKRKRGGDAGSAGIPQLPFPAPEPPAEQPAAADLPARKPTTKVGPEAEASPSRRAAVRKLRSDNSVERPEAGSRPRGTRRLAARLFEPPAPSAEAAEVKPIPEVGDPDPAEIKRLIDSIVARQAAAVPPPPNQTIAEEASLPPADRLIFLSRTLSGLVDLIIVCFCAASFVLAADFFSGVDRMDAWSVVYYSLLFLAVHFVYSIFFLATAHQTIGMMIRELQVVDARGHNPTLGQVCVRSAAFIPALMAAGMGLLWGVFDRRSRCLHDWLSDTRVARL